MTGAPRPDAGRPPVTAVSSARWNPFRTDSEARPACALRATGHAVSSQVQRRIPRSAPNGLTGSGSGVSRPPPPTCLGVPLARDFEGCGRSGPRSKRVVQMLVVCSVAACLSFACLSFACLITEPCSAPIRPGPMIRLPQSPGRRPAARSQATPPDTCRSVLQRGIDRPGEIDRSAGGSYPGAAFARRRTSSLPPKHHLEISVARTHHPGRRIGSIPEQDTSRFPFRFKRFFHASGAVGVIPKP